MTTGSISRFVAPALLALGALLAAWNWRLQPDRAAAWIAALVTIGVMAIALAFASRGYANSAVRQAGREITRAVGFAGLILVLGLASKLAANLGAPSDGVFSRRLSMAVIGLFFMAMGNAFPKMLTPLASLRCSPAKVQAFQRFTGWVWVMTGLGYALAWLVLPIDLANPIAMALMLAGMLTVATQVVRLKWRRQA